MKTRSIITVGLLLIGIGLISSSALAETMEFVTYFPATTAKGLGGPPAFDSGWIDWEGTDGNYAWTDVTHSIGTEHTFIYVEARDIDGNPGAGINAADRGNGVWWTNKTVNTIRLWGFHGGIPEEMDTRDQVRVQIWNLG